MTARIYIDYDCIFVKNEIIMAKIPSVKFNLKVPKSQKETLIFLVFRYRGQRLLYSTGLTILPSEWKFDLQRPIQKERRPDLWAIQRQLDDLAAHCKAIYIESRYGAIKPSSFKHKLNEEIGKQDGDESIHRNSLISFLEEELKSFGEVNANKGTKKMFKQHIKILKEFITQNDYSEFEEIDWSFRLALIDWLTKRNVQLAYGNKTLSVLRQFMERARKKKLHSNVNYQGSGWLVPRKPATGQKVILTPDELQTLADLQLFGLAEKVRDLFLIGAGTGQRYSDYSKYTPDNFYRTLDGTPLLSIISQKTATPAKIPLNIFPWLIPTLEKHNYASPQVSMQKLNVIIKELCQKAGIDGKVLKVEQYMGRKARIEKNYVAKYKLVSSHTCRRSFATNLYRMGYSLGQIMPMTGHATETQLRVYIGIDAEENALAIARSIEQRKNNQ